MPLSSCKNKGKNPHQIYFIVMQMFHFYVYKGLNMIIEDYMLAVVCYVTCIS